MHAGRRVSLRATLGRAFFDGPDRYPYWERKDNWDKVERVFARTEFK